MIVGAGLSGLLAARTLVAAGRRVQVIEKSRGVGGRMATRRIDGLVADHGAQFFTAHDTRFAGLVREWENAGVVRRWTTGFSVPDGAFKDNGVPRYCGSTGMTAIGKHLAQGLEVKLQAKVNRIAVQGDAWTVTTDDGAAFECRALLLTAPVPQSLQLLAAGEVPLPDAVREGLEQTDYSSGFTLLAKLPGPSQVPDPGGMWLCGEPLWWITDNRQKGLCPGPETIVTIHAGPEFSETHWNAPEEEVVAKILEAAAPWLGGSPVLTQVHRWRYNVPRRIHPAPFLRVPDVPPLILAGDAFGGPRIEAAALSGLAAGDALIECLAKSG